MQYGACCCLQCVPPPVLVTPAETNVVVPTIYTAVKSVVPLYTAPKRVIKSTEKVHVRMYVPTPE